MTEMEWLGSDDPIAMLNYLESLPAMPSKRKLRLFAIACVRSIWHLLADGRSRRAVEAAERYADGQVTEEELLPIRAIAREVWCSEPACLPCMAIECLNHSPWIAAVREPWFRSNVSAADQTTLLRDLIGNPWRPVKPTHQAAWLGLRCNHQTVALARAAYEERRIAGCELCQGQPIRTLHEPLWGSDQAICPRCNGQTDGFLDSERLLVLSDALEDAGCNNIDLLTHLRGSGPHAVGCWALDLILGKE